MSDILRHILETKFQYYQFPRIILNRSVDPYVGAYRVISWFEHNFDPENVNMRWRRKFLYKDYARGTLIVNRYIVPLIHCAFGYGENPIMGPIQYRFKNKYEYENWCKQWATSYSLLSEAIKRLKSMRASTVPNVRSTPDGDLVHMATVARQMLECRKNARIRAAHLYAAKQVNKTHTFRLEGQSIYIEPSPDFIPEKWFTVIDGKPYYFNTFEADCPVVYSADVGKMEFRPLIAEVSTFEHMIMR